MKKLLTGLCLLTMLTVNAQVKRVKIRGTIANAENTELLLRNTDQTVLAKTTINKGKFEIITDLEIGDARHYALHMPSLGGLGPAMNIPLFWFFINSTNISIEAAVDKKNLQLKKIRGASWNEEYNKLINGLPVSPLINKATERYNKAFDLYNRVEQTKENLQLLKAAGNEMDSLGDVRNQQIEQLAKNKPANMMATVMAVQYLGWTDSLPKLEALYNTFDPAVHKNYYLIGLKRKIERLKAIRIGSIAPDFALNDVKGEELQLSALRGKYVLLDFWASWCGPCRKENPVVLKAYEKFKDRNFTVLGVSIDDKADAWQKAVKEDGLPWQQLIDKAQPGKGKVSALYEVKGIPANFLLDPQGKIIAVNLRGPALEQALEKFVR